VEAAIFVVIVGTVLGIPAVSTMRRRARLKHAPSGSRQTVTVQVANASTTIQRWGKLAMTWKSKAITEPTLGEWAYQRHGPA
jgi:hypothetical protein